MLQACGEQLTGLIPRLASEEIIAVIRAAKLYKLRNLHWACRDRIGEIGVDFLVQDAVCDLLSADRDLYKEIVNATKKRRRTV